MRIRKLEIVGFKSFCDRTVLTFDQPITGVVGPNGCGKSNIVDAIRWCMGEQSARHLRGKSMEDVLFSGADTRKPSGLCEVSLTFENDGRAPVDYLAFSEITVTRRLLRDGTSEYLLNRAPCRLRDITDFFLGTGVGARAYAIIEQGRIGMIVSSKPEDRRVLVEEAAGITRFRAKKKAAEKKMEWTRHNLVRVSDVVAEIENQLGSLRRQAQKAERYRAYKAELRELDLWSAAQRWLGLHAAERVAAAALLEATDGCGEAQAALVAREAAAEASRLGAAEQARHIEMLQEQLYELDNRIRLGEVQADHDARQGDGLDERARSAGSEVEELARRIEVADAELLRLRGEARAAEEGGAGQSEALRLGDEEVRALKQQAAAVQLRSEAAHAEIARAQAGIARADASDRAHVRRLEDLELRLARVGEEELRLGGRDGELAAEIGRLDDCLARLRAGQAQRQESARAAEARLGAVRTAIAGAAHEAGELDGALRVRRSRQQSLIEIQQRYEGFARGTRAIMGRAGAEEGLRWGIRGLVADVVRAPAEYEVAIEVALGERLGSVVVESHEAALDGVEYLKSRREGRAGFVPLRTRSLGAAGAVAPGSTGAEAPVGLRAHALDVVTCDDEFAPLARALLGEVVIVDDLLTALDMWKAGARHTLVTVDGEVVDPRGLVAGGARDAAGAGVLQRKRELRELEGAIADLAARHAAAAAQLAALEAEREELVAAIDALRSADHGGELAVVTADKDLSRAREEQARLAARRAAIGSERADLERQRDETRLESEADRRALRAAREALVAAEEGCEREGRESVDAIDRLEGAQARLTALRIAAAQVEEKRRAIARALMQTDGQRGDGVAHRERLTRSMRQWTEEAAALRGVVQARRRELAGLAADSRSRGAELSSLRAAHEQLRLGLMTGEAEIKALRAHHEKAARRVAELELRLHDATVGRAHLEEQAAERYRVRLVDQLHAFHLRPPAGDVEEARARELRDLIERMGEINLTAIDEYNTLEERYRFLCAQKGDLEQALAQLEEAIARINRTSRKRFREVFDLVNQRFQELFPRLFQGGRAHLTLTDEEDLLESGIEIFAQPPGKKNSTVELLSGGEKALTAVSLVFAIFLIKPAPFCVLDEVDAPLDEANVDRFNDLVRAMTDRSQFIVITHNKRTMETVDTLYGVTQEEPGISKLVSVNLTVAGSAAAA